MMASVMGCEGKLTADGSPVPFLGPFHFNMVIRNTIIVYSGCAHGRPFPPRILQTIGLTRT